MNHLWKTQWKELVKEMLQWPPFAYQEMGQLSMILYKSWDINLKKALIKRASEKLLLIDFLKMLILK